MIYGRQSPLIVHAEAQPLTRGRTMAHRAVHLLPAQHELDRPADQTCRQYAEDCWSGQQPLGAEASAKEGTANPDILWRQAEQPGDSRLRQSQSLGRDVRS